MDIVTALVIFSALLWLMVVLLFGYAKSLHKWIKSVQEYTKAVNDITDNLSKQIDLIVKAVGLSNSPDDKEKTE